MKSILKKNFEPDVLENIKDFKSKIQNFKNLKIKSSSSNDEHKNNFLECINKYFLYARFLEINYNSLIHKVITNLDTALLKKYFHLMGRKYIKELFLKNNFNEIEIIKIKLKFEYFNYKKFRREITKTTKHHQQYFNLNEIFLNSFRLFFNKYHQKILDLATENLNILEKIEKFINDFYSQEEITLEQIKASNQEEIDNIKQNISKWKKFFYIITFKQSFKSIGRKYNDIKELENKELASEVQKINNEFSNFKKIKLELQNKELENQFEKIKLELEIVKPKLNKIYFNKRVSIRNIEIDVDKEEIEEKEPFH